MKRIILNFPFYKIVAQFIFISFLFFLIFSLYTCSEGPVGPVANIDAGVAGIVYDTSGHPLDSVRIYCLYSFFYNPIPMKSQANILRISNSKKFEFNLFQNFPNPVQNSTFLRFSLPTSCSVNISITERATGKIRYTYSKSLLEGLYQLYLNNLVDSLQLPNGRYTYNIVAKSELDTEYNASKEMFVASDHGNPSDLTKTDGKYFFDYKNAFVGDSVAIFSSELIPIYNVVLGRNINLLLERRGYYSLFTSMNLSPKIQIHSDLIMTRNSQQ